MLTKMLAMTCLFIGKTVIQLSAVIIKICLYVSKSSFRIFAPQFNLRLLWDYSTSTSPALTGRLLMVKALNEPDSSTTSLSIWRKVVCFNVILMIT